MCSSFDESLLADFLAEGRELIDQLDGDLVRLESARTGPRAAELLNSIFRALHTVKGAAGFLNLETLTVFAHAAEDALNRLRKGDVAVTPAIMDALLRSVDVLRGMVSQLDSGAALTPCPPELISALKAIASDAAPAQEAPVPQAAATTAADGETPLQVPAQKEAILDLMVADLRDSTAQAENLAAKLVSGGERAAARELEDLFEALARSLEFFELGFLAELSRACALASGAIPELTPAPATQASLRVRAAVSLIRREADSLERRRVSTWNTQTLTARLRAIASGEALDAAAFVNGADPAAALAVDGVESSSPASDTPAPAPAITDSAPPPSDVRAKTDSPEKAAGETTIRVEVARLEALLSLVGQLVLTKNRTLALSRKLREHELPAQLNSELAAAAGELDRLTGELQMGVMRTRMQPLAKLFDRYPRVIRDVARATGKQIALEITGKDTEVDKSVLELLADPLVHMLRNSADHGIESAEARLAAGKPAEGTIRVSADHRGSHVRVVVRDDGKGIDPQVIARKAVEKGLATQEEVATLTDEQIIQYIFAPGFSTAEKVTDLSGRGVGMDVVRTNVSRMGGSVSVTSKVGLGSAVEIEIPLTVAIMPALVVGVGTEHYCVPLQCVLEIVRPPQEGSPSIGGQPLLRLRDEILPLVDTRQVMGQPAPEQGKFAVVVASGNQRAGLMVDRLVGQQEIVIRPLEDEITQGGPFSGATIREEGDVSLILDINQMLRRWETAGQRRGAASAA